MNDIIAIYPLTPTSRIFIRKLGRYHEILLETGDLIKEISHWRMQEILEQYHWDHIPTPEDRQGSSCSGSIG
jgi:hypothetical protein